MTTERNRILAIIDPTRSDQWALRRAVKIAKNQEGVDVCAFLCVYSGVEADDPADLQAVELGRHAIWLDGILSDLAESGVSIAPMVVWNKKWRDAICTAAASPDVSLVVKRASGRPKSLANSDRKLIRSLQRELLLVKRDPDTKMRKILVAVDFNATDEGHVTLNEAVMSLGRDIRGSRDNIELHAVSAYPDSDKFVHPPDVAKKLDIDRGQAHVRQGSAADVIPETANNIEADLVIVGNVGRAGLSGITIGNTAEKILAEIESDVAILVRSDEEQRAAA